jgi:hypothetical protein
MSPVSPTPYTGRARGPQRAALFQSPSNSLRLVRQPRRAGHSAPYLLAAFLCALLLPASAQNVGFGNVPLYFEANRGQSDAPVQFIARTRDGVFRLTASEALVTLAKASAPTGSKKTVERTRWNKLQTTSLRLQFLGANPAARISGTDPLPGKVNYLLGDNPKGWQKKVPTFTRVQVDKLYPGIQLAYYGNGRQLEYDFVVAPRVDPGVIAFRVSGADQLQVDAQGDLLLKVGSAVLRQQKPILYQLSNGQRMAVAGGYQLRDANTVSFEVGPYDHSLPLIIDPVLTYSSFLGGQGSDTGRAVVLDSAGNIYVTGDTLSGQLALTNAFEPAYMSGYPNAGGDAFVAKFDPTGTNLLFLTYLGGNGDDAAISIALDSAGNSYVTGVTDSTNFPTLLAISNNIAGKGKFGLNYHPYDAFVAKLDATGDLVYSTYLGGSDSDEGLGIAVDPNTSIAYVAGFTQSTNFPTFHPFQGTRIGSGNAFVAALAQASNGLQFVYSTYLGGYNVDHAEDIAVDALGQAYITGFTTSTNFPITTNAFQTFPSNRKTSDAFVTVLTTNGASLVSSTFLGGVGADIGYRLTLDSAGAVYVTGSQSSLGFPITPGNLNPGGVFTSGDGAATWTADNTGLLHNQVYGIALDTNSSPLKLYAVTGRGIMLSTNAGATWATSLNTVTQYVSIVIAPGTPSTLYAGGTGVLKTTNAGASWFSTSTGLTKQPINKLLLDPQAPATVYAATEGSGVFKSTDAAATWQHASGGLTSKVKDLAFDPSNSSILYAATPNGIYRTQDGGTRWKLFKDGLTNHLTRTVAVDPVTPSTVYAGTQHGNVFKSLNAGTNWFPVNSGLSSSNFVTTLAIDPVTPSTVYAGTTNGLFKSLNAGTNWSLATNGLTFADIATLVINPASPSTIYAGIFGKAAFGATDAFVTKLSPDLSTLLYSVALGGNALDQGWDIAVDSAGDAFVVGTTYSTNFPTAQTMGLLSSTNAGGTNFFTTAKRPGPTTGDVFVTAINPDASAYLYSAYLGGGSNDFGLSIAVDAAGNAVILGQTFSPGFPTVGARQPALYGFSDAFLARILLSSPSVAATVQTDPAGLTLIVDGVTNVSPFTTNWPQGSFHSVSTLPVQTGTNGLQYNWSAWSDDGGLSHTLLVNGDTTLTASFTTNTVVPGPLAQAKGSYTGLFFNTNAEALAMSSSGLFSANVRDQGAFSAKLRFVQRNASISGHFSSSGFFSNAIPRHKPFRALSVVLQLDVNANTITGHLTDGEWSADLLANRSPFSAATPAPQANKKYTLLIPGAAESIGQPAGDSFATLSVNSSGNVRFAGTLADGTRVSQSSFESAAGEWPLFIPLYKHHRSGLLIGWLNFTNAPDTDIAGFVDWFKLGQVVTNAYPGGFLIQSEPIGSLYSFTNGVPVLSFGGGSGSLVLENGGLPQSLTNSISLNSANQFSSPSPLTLSLTPSTGLLKGSLRDPAVSRKTIPLNGVVLQKQNLGAGYFSFTNQIGRVLLLP